ncbi:MAG TPA: sugar phosphate nucleotidyltransferase [Polyangiaceae bacterium]|nr:sugar phosphate nucleotidyltransferase [Polyangiaceae bacterium]
MPAAGRGSRMQPLAFSKELLPVGSRKDGASDRPVAVSEYLIDRMLEAGVTKLCFVISPGKSDILDYYGGHVRGVDTCYVVQDQPRGLCDALFRALPFIEDNEQVCVGLPDTVWFPHDALRAVATRSLNFLLFPVEHPELFDAVSFDSDGRVQQIQVKATDSKSHWIWGAFSATGATLRELHRLWMEPDRADEYLGTLVNEYISRGGVAWASPVGRAYVDVGTLHGYREASRLLEAFKLLGDSALVEPVSARMGAPEPGASTRSTLKEVPSCSKP